ncbi:MAG: YtxH domain-containing protein [Bacilli bacterium]|jgi:gas vesicle protein|nr:YtxH domain-containing protein [Bacilli bacterium]
MSKKTRGSKFLLGALVGLGMGFLFAPKKGCETRRDLMKKIDEFIAKIKEINIEDVRETLETKLEEIKMELEDLDKEKALKIAKTKANDLKDKVEELVTLAVAKSTPVIAKAAEDVRDKVLKAAKDTIEKLEKNKGK